MKTQKQVEIVVRIIFVGPTQCDCSCPELVGLNGSSFFFFKEVDVPCEASTCFLLLLFSSWSRACKWILNIYPHRSFFIYSLTWQKCMLFTLIVTNGILTTSNSCSNEHIPFRGMRLSWGNYFQTLISRGVVGNRGCVEFFTLICSVMPLCIDPHLWLDFLVEAMEF